MSQELAFWRIGLWNETYDPFYNPKIKSHGETLYDLRDESIDLQRGST